MKYHGWYLNSAGLIMLVFKPVPCLETAKKLWEELGDIPIDENENIELPFLHFSVGTYRYEIWHWFEEHFDLSVVEDLMIKETV